MKINPKVCITKQQEVIACTCSKTGIVSALVIPQLPVDSKGHGFVFDYVHPISHWSNAQGMIKAGRNYISKLEPQVLAGLALVVFNHYSLLDKYELSAQEANAILCTASTDTLIDLLSLAALITDKNSAGTPALVLEWRDIKDQQTIDRQLASYIKTLKAEFISSVKEDNNDPMRRIKILNAHVGQGRSFKNGVTLLSAKQSMASFEREFEDTFRAAKKEIKDLIAYMRKEGAVSIKLLDFLSALTAGRNLVAMSAEVRVQLCAKLHAIASTEADRIASLLQDCNNPYDIFAKADESLERASDSFLGKVKPKSLKEILEAKKLAANSLVLTTQEEEVEELLDYVPEEENEALSEEEDGLEDTYSRMTSGIYSSTEF